MTQAGSQAPEPEQESQGSAPIGEITAPAIYWKPWVVKHIGEGDGEQFHCTPEGDTNPHILSTNCPCTPFEVGDRYTTQGRLLPLYMHSSWDWREMDEKWYFGIHGPEVDNEIE
jgi:hypothetical protein